MKKSTVILCLMAMAFAFALSGSANASFIDNLDGTITDNDSGLVWLKDASCAGLAGTDSSGTGNWFIATAAAAVCGDGTCGLTDGSEPGDWRLPTNAEWLSLFNAAYQAPALDNTVGDAQWSEGDPFVGVQSTHYWSGTEYDSDDAWFADVSVGNIHSVPQSKGGNSVYIWPVRNGDTAPVPLPPSWLLFASGLVAWAGLRKLKKK